jgi:hypothetical protein
VFSNGINSMGIQMKTRTIGQCSKCGYIDRHFDSSGKLMESGNCKFMRDHFIVSEFGFIDDVFEFGCWFWKEKK